MKKIYTFVKIHLFILLLIVPLGLQAQNSSGILAFTGYKIVNNANSYDRNDEFSFVLLEDLPAATPVYFTDFGVKVNSPSIVLQTPTDSKTDGIIEWSRTSELKKGTSIKITLAPYPIASIGTVINITNQIELGIAGDQLFAYTNLAAKGLEAAMLINRPNWDNLMPNLSSSSSLKPNLDKSKKQEAIVSNTTRDAYQAVITQVNYSGITDIISAINASSFTIKTSLNVDEVVLPPDIIGIMVNYPKVILVNSLNANGTYIIGQELNINVAFDKFITVVGTPQLTLETGAIDRVINYSSGSGTNILTFKYTVQEGDISQDLDYTSATALSLNGGSIKDSNGNNAILTLAAPGSSGSLGANKNIVVNGIRTAKPSTPVLSANSDTGNSNSDNITKLNSLIFSGTAEAGSNVFLYDTDGTTQIGNGLANNGNWTITTSVLAEGSHMITAKAINNSGNISLATNPVNITIDTFAPIVTGVVNNGIYSEDVMPTFNEGFATLNDASFSNGTILVAEGNYTLIVTDIAGNSTTIKFVISKTTIWENGQWNNGSPDVTKKAILRASYPANITAKSLTFEADVVVPKGVVYDILEEVNNTTHQVVFEHGAYLIQRNDLLKNNAIISFKRKSKPVYRLETMDWSSPVLGQNILALSPNTLPNRFYRYDEKTNAWVNNIKSPDLFLEGEYIAFRAPNDFNDYGNGPSRVFEGTFTGIPINGLFIKPAFKSNFGNNAIGNPYPSPIDLSRFVNLNQPLNISKVFVWTHSKPIVNGEFNGNNWAVYNPTLGWDDPSITSNILDVGQGFIVQIQNQGLIMFNNSIRVAPSGNTPIISYKNQTEDDKFWLSLTNESIILNSTLIAYKEGSTKEYESNFDSEPMQVYPGIYSLIKDKEMSIQGRGNQFDLDDRFGLAVKFLTPGNYTIKRAKTNGLFSQEQSIYLIDNETKSYTDLSKEDYHFISDKGYYKNRFEIIYNSALLSTNELDKVNGVDIYTKESTVVIKSNEKLKSVKIYDLDGKLIKLVTNLNTLETAIQTNAKGQVLVVWVELINGTNTSKKIIIK